MTHENDLIRRGDVIAILSVASRTAQKTIDAIAALPTAQVTVKPLEWEPIGNMFHAFDPLFSVTAISENPNAYDDERAARIRSALTVTTHDRAALAAGQPADPVTNAGCCQPVKVKPMAWVKHPSKDIWRSDQPFGTYKVFGVGRTPSWDFDSLSNGQDKISKTADSVNAAKAAAQADYEGRILAALEPAPVTLADALKVPEVQAMAEALRELLIAADGESYAKYLDAIETATATMRAIEEATK